MMTHSLNTSIPDTVMAEATVYQELGVRIAVASPTVSGIEMLRLCIIIAFS
jgi:hypothetical protein